MLGQLDPGQFPNGFYHLRLTARDMARRTGVAERVVEINTPTNPAAYRRTETDLQVELDGVTVALTRTYDGLAGETQGEFGYGWCLTPRHTDIQTNAPLTGREHLGVYAAASGLMPAAPVIVGLEPLWTHVSGDRAMGLFAVGREAMYQLLVPGADGSTSGGYQLRVGVASDVNADGLVDGVDSALMAGAQGTAAGEPRYLAEADLDFSGVIDAQDTLILAANYGFVANRRPTISPTSPELLTHEDLALTIPLEGIFYDPDADVLGYQPTGVEHGTVTLSADGRTAAFVPDPGFVGTAHLSLIADDGGNVSEETILDISVSDAPLLGIEIDNRLPQLAAGGATQLVVLGNFADQHRAPLIGGYVSFASSLGIRVLCSGGGHLCHTYGLRGLARSGTAGLLGGPDGRSAVPRAGRDGGGPRGCFPRGSADRCP